jgi:peptidoglycan-associated lipoprotein
MKRTPFLIGILLLAAVFMAVSCSSKPPVEEEQPPVVEPEPPPPPPPPPVEEPDLPPPPVEIVLETVYFDFDKYNLKPDAKAALANNAALLKNNADVTILIEGNCDERGTQEYNLALGEKRANAARSYLVDLGISASRIRVISYGYERPVDPGHNEAAWAKNRRADFVRTDQ